jgi:hypothetical protein
MNWFADGDLDWNLTWFGFDGTNEVGPYGPSGLATFVLDLETGYKVKHRWPLDLHKFRSGKERRISRNDAPQESYDGSAVLLGELPRNVRATLARYAAQSGATFLLALPHEEISILDITGSTVTVGTTTKSDWAKQGQRVVCVFLDDDDVTQFSEGTIQSVTATTIVTDTAPDSQSYAIMPLRPIYLEPQQTFARYPVEAEVWSLQARAAIFDFAPELATVDLGDDAIATARAFGAYGNLPSIAVLEGLPAGPTTYGLNESGLTTIFYYEAGVSTYGDLATALESSANFLLGGSYNPSALIPADFALTQASGGEVAGSQGTGETLTEYGGDGTDRPVWDRKLVVATTAADSVQAMTQIIDHGGIPYSLGTADEPDWGRSVQFVSEDWFDWQWLKLFFATTLGPQKAFWLPTWRDDLTPISHAPGAPGLVDIDISTEDGSDFTAWWPQQREHVQIVLSTGEVEYAEIADAVDNGDGTRTISVALASLTGDIEMLSWLELCRFESEEFEFVFGDHGVELKTTARVVQQ